MHTYISEFNGKSRRQNPNPNSKTLSSPFEKYENLQENINKNLFISRIRKTKGYRIYINLQMTHAYKYFINIDS